MLYDYYSPPTGAFLTVHATAVLIALTRSTRPSSGFTDVPYGIQFLDSLRRGFLVGNPHLSVRKNSRSKYADEF